MKNIVTSLQQRHTMMCRRLTVREEARTRCTAKATRLAIEIKAIKEEIKELASALEKLA